MACDLTMEELFSLSKKTRVSSQGNERPARRSTAYTDYELDPTILRRLLLTWLAEVDLPLATVHSESFKRFIEYANPEAAAIIAEIAKEIVNPAAAGAAGGR